MSLKILTESRLWRLKFCGFFSHLIHGMKTKEYIDQYQYLPSFISFFTASLFSIRLSFPPVLPWTPTLVPCTPDPDLSFCSLSPAPYPTPVSAWPHPCYPRARFFILLRSPRIDSKESIPPAYVSRAGILKQSRNRVGIGLSYQPARLHRLAEFIPWIRFLGSINV